MVARLRMKLDCECQFGTKGREHIVRRGEMKPKIVLCRIGKGRAIYKGEDITFVSPEIDQAHEELGSFPLTKENIYHLRRFHLRTKSGLKEARRYDLKLKKKLKRLEKMLE